MTFKYFRNYVLSFWLALFFTWSLGTHAAVNYMNGNFFISYTDIVVPGGGEPLEIIRTYNSHSKSPGWFGYGWGSLYETRIEVQSDGSIVVNENGNGGKTLFYPKSGRLSAEDDAKKIVDAMKKKGGINQKVADDLIVKLKGDAELRRTYAKNVGVTSQVATGTILYSNQRGIQQVHRIADGFKRIFNDGRYETFNNIGLMIKKSEKSGYEVTIEYDGNKVNNIKDSAAKQLFFSWTPDGRVKEVWSKENVKVQYAYDSKQNLIKSTDVGKHTYVYDYDVNHGLTSIAYEDKTKMEIKYDKELFVQMIKDRNGKITTMKFERDKKAPDLHYWTEVEEKFPSGVKNNSKIEYEHKRKADGELFTYRIVNIENGVKEDTTYDEACLLPVQITDGSFSTKFVYNQGCLLTEKNSSNGESTKLQYHPKFNKITRVDMLTSQKQTSWTKFDYDDQGNLSKAEDSNGKAVLLVYDRTGQITKMVDANITADKKKTINRSLAFKYNAMGKPTEIALDKAGKINVDYDNFGEIKNVKSSGSNEMTYQVTEAFTNLLEIVKPAGVDLSL